MDEQNEELTEKYSLFQKDILNENNFLRKIKDIFNLQNDEKFQDILILQKNRYLEQIEKEVLLIIKNIYSEKIIINKKFNSLFKLGKEWIESKYNYCYEEIISEWEKFNASKNSNYLDEEEKTNTYYIKDFRKHCLNHDGLAIHKCGHGEKGKFIKIFAKPNSRFKYKKELKYIICEECKKVFLKDFFISYCNYCKENYLCTILNENEDKETFIATYSSPHCDSLINKTIPCKLCKEKLFIFVKDKKLKCLKCNYIIDLNNKSELQWQCTKCNKYFKSNIKIFNSTENLIVQKIIKKALLIKKKASPKFMNCCDNEPKNYKFFHKNDCKGILYFCNIENYLLKNKKYVIVCEKCHAIHNYKNFTWTCPKCGKKIKESNQENEEYIPKKRENEMNNINTINSEEKILKSSFFQNYSSNLKSKSPLFSSFVTEDNNNQNKKNRYDSNKNNKIDNKIDIKDNNENKNEEIERIKVNKCSDKFINNNNNSNRKYFFRSKRYNNRNSDNNIKLEKKDNNNNNSNISIDKFKNSRDKYKNRQKVISKEENQNNEDDNKNNNDKKKIENAIPFPRRNNMKCRYLIISPKIKVEEKLKENIIDINRGDSCKSSNIYINNKEEKKNENYNIDYLNKNNYEEDKGNIFFNIKNRRNNPVRLRYVNDKKEDNCNIKKSVDIEQSNNKILNKYEKEGEDDKSKRLLIYSVDEKIVQNEDGIMSKETTAHGSKGSAISYSKESSINKIKKSDNSNVSNDTSKDKDYLYLSVSNFNFRNKRKYYIKEKEKEQLNNIQNVKNNISNQDSKKNKDFKSNDIESNNSNGNKLSIYELNKPDDIIEPNNINFSEDIEIFDNKLKENKELYNSIQEGIKGLLEKGGLPLFNIDDYIIGKKIGDGAFGVLFSVMNKKTGKNYALKKLTACDLKSLEEFFKEFQIAYKSNHQNILNIYGICIRVYDSTTFSLFVLMALGECDWEIEINERFKEKKYYSEEELIKILKQLSSALVYLQNNEIAHRDIKPENIIIFHENDEIIYRICDFGEAKEKIKVNSRHKSIRGTDFYMSPILFKGLTQEEKFVKDNAYKSDVFSLGYCMIIASVLDFNFINKIRNLEEQPKIDRIIRENLESRYSYNFIRILLKMIVYCEKERIDFLGLEKLINEEL